MTWIELEDEVEKLENAERLLYVYIDFFKECPTEEELKEDGRDVEIKAIVFAVRAQKFQSVLQSAFMLVKGVREKLSDAVEKTGDEIRQ